MDIRCSKRLTKSFKWINLERSRRTNWNLYVTSRLFHLNTSSHCIKSTTLRIFCRFSVRGIKQWVSGVTGIGWGWSWYQMKDNIKEHQDPANAQWFHVSVKVDLRLKLGFQFCSRFSRTFQFQCATQGDLDLFSHRKSWKSNHRYGFLSSRRSRSTSTPLQMTSRFS